MKLYKMFVPEVFAEIRQFEKYLTDKVNGFSRSVEIYKGVYKNAEGHVSIDHMRVFLIATYCDTIYEVALAAKKIFKQESIMYFVVSEEVYFE